MHCLKEIEASVRTLPVNAPVLDATARAQEFVNQLSPRELVRESLHKDLDALQAQFGDLHQAISDTWFESKQVVAS